ncbi:MAG: hypothetical protein RL156_276 [Bacteroidota bacterium]
MSHRLRSFDITMLVISLVIGIGIFRTPQIVAQQAGTLPLFALAWVLGAFCSMCGALTFARIGTMHPVAGGFYSIFSTSYHPGLAFAMNWSLVVTNAASMAGVALIGAEYLAPVIVQGPVRDIHLHAIVCTIVLTLYMFNVRGLRWGAGTQNALSLLKIVMILGLSSLMFFVMGNVSGPQPIHESLQQSAGGASLHDQATWYSALGAALISVFFTYGGYQSTINIGSDIDTPQRTFPRGIISAMIIVLLLYGFVNLAYVYVLGFEAVKTSPLVAAQLASAVFGENGMRVTGIVIVVSVLGFLNSGLMCLPQTMTAMAEDGMLPSYFARSKHGEAVNARTLTVFTVLMLVLYFGLGTFQRLMNYVMFTDSMALALGAGCVYVLSAKSKSNDNIPIPSLLSWISHFMVPAVFIVIMLIVTLNVTISEPGNAIAGTMVFMLGALVFILRRRVLVKGKKV